MKSDDYCQTGTDASGFYRGDGSGELSSLLDVSCGIHPSVSVPPTVLVTEMDTGALVLQGRRDGPRVHLSSKDAVPLRRELAAAFVLGDFACAEVGSNGGD